MAFHEVQFPVDISYRSTGGPGYKTDIVQTIGGQEYRLPRWPGAGRRRYNVARGIRELEDGGADDISTIISFYIARQGPVAGFRYKDHLDYTTATNHRDAPSATDESIGTGDASETQFQLVKRYISGPTTQVRNIRKPVSGTVVVSLDDVVQTSGFSVDYTTGIITFTSPPGMGVEVKAGCEFDVPARFDTGSDEFLDLGMEAYKTGIIPDIPIIELDEDDLVNPEEFNYGGASTSGAGGLIDDFDADMTITPAMGRVIILDPQSGGLNANLPDASTFGIVPGAPHFYIKNSSGANAFNLLDQGLALIKSVAAGEMVIATLSDTNIWHILSP